MDDFRLTDEQLRYLCDLIIQNMGDMPKPDDLCTGTFRVLNAEATRREELAEAASGLSLDDDCDGCKL